MPKHSFASNRESKLYGSNFLFTGYQSYPSQRDQTNGQNTIKSGMSLIPQFDTTIPTNVTALVGKSAYLSCKVQNLGNKTVSITFPFVSTFHDPNALPFSALLTFTTETNSINKK